jgi:hypothetical protein
VELKCHELSGKESRWKSGEANCAGKALISVAAEKHGVEKLRQGTDWTRGGMEKQRKVLKRKRSEKTGKGRGKLRNAVEWKRNEKYGNS